MKRYVRGAEYLDVSIDGVLVSVVRNGDAGPDMMEDALWVYDPFQAAEDFAAWIPYALKALAN